MQQGLLCLEEGPTVGRHRHCRLSVCTAAAMLVIKDDSHKSISHCDATRHGTGNDQVLPRGDA